MVKLEEVEDEAFAKQQPGDEGDWDTDEESDASSVISAASEDDSPLSESVSDRISALADIIPPQTRLQLSKTANNVTEWGWWGFSGLCKVTWLVGVSGLLLGIPFAVGQSEDQLYAAEEKQLQAQQSANDFVAPGASSVSPKSQQPL